LGQSQVLVTTPDEDYVLRTFRATLIAIRPQLVGEIADDADRMLALSGEARS
jgi:hypothetical protein